MAFGQYSPGSGRMTQAESFQRRPAIGIVGKPKTIYNNTFRWTKEDGATVIRLHTTDIVTIRPDGKLVLDSGGFKTATTKARMNAHLKGCTLYSGKGTWTLREQATGREAPFYDGVVVPDCFDKPKWKVAEAQKKMSAKINAFVKRIDTWKPQMPSNGDCWYCLMKDQDGKSLGDLSGSDHLHTHIREGYLHGSLIVNACRWAGCTDFLLSSYFHHGQYKDHIKRALRRYLRRQLGLG